MKPRQRQAAILEFLQSQENARSKSWRNTSIPLAPPSARIWSRWKTPAPSFRTYGGVVLNKDEADPPIDHKTLINTHKKAQIAEAAVRPSTMAIQLSSTPAAPCCRWCHC